MTDVEKIVPYLIIAVAAFAVLVIVFIFPIFYDIFIGRGVCKFVGLYLMKAILSTSIITGITEAGITAFCNTIPF